jgi:Alternative complex III, ActD subunit
MTAWHSGRPPERPALMAEFSSGDALLGGIRALRDCGVSRFDAFTPYEVPGLQELLGVRRSWLTWIALAVGLAFGGGAYLLQWWINVVDYPLNIGGRPYHSAPAFIPITFEMCVLFGSAAALISALVLGGLPRLWHPVFEVEGFERATIDRFWLAVGVGDAALDRARNTEALVRAGALRVEWLGDAPPVGPQGGSRGAP